MDPFAPRTSRSGLFVLCLVFIAFGIYVFPLAIGAFRSGLPIQSLALNRQYDWLEAMWMSFLSVLVGVGGIWALVRQGRRKQP